jgi:hypothetical protein
MHSLVRWLPYPVVCVLVAFLGLTVIGCQDDDNGEPENTIPTANVAFVLTGIFGGTGSYSVVDLASRETFNDINPGGVHSDAIPARLFGGLIYVVNRFGVDSIQVIDPLQEYTTPSGLEQSVGNGTNPLDIAFVNINKAYVSRLSADSLVILNPVTLARLGEVDLSDLTKPDDADGLPEVARMLVHNGLLYSGGVCVKVAPGELVVINPATDQIVGIPIALRGQNPEAFLQFSPAVRGGRILVSSVGNFQVIDGGIEAVNPATNTVDTTFVIDEATLGGDVTHFEVVSATRGFAVVIAPDATGTNSLVSFNPTSGRRLSVLFVAPPRVFLPHFAISSRNELYLAVHDQTTTANPGIRIFNTQTDTEITQAPLSTGDLPPAFVLMIE